MISFILVVSCLGGLVSCAPSLFYDIEDAESHFEAFIVAYNKIYNEAEKKIRFEIFKQHLVDINEKNAKANKAIHGITKFCDLTPAEFQARYSSRINSYRAKDCNIRPGNVSNNAPDQFDWRDKNVVTKVSDQEDCGACWAFSTAGNIESQYALKYNQLKEFSKSQLVDCDQELLGCNGGDMGSAMLYLSEAGGIMSELDYPYTPAEDECKFDESKVAAKLKGCDQYDVASEDDLKEVLFATGPLSIGVDARSFQTYHQGILDGCEQGALGHAVLLVGYGVENDIPYWLIKNSWGTVFGENGYIRVKRGVNSCAILSSGQTVVNAIVA